MKENTKEEFLEVVDEDNQVIRIASRYEIHKKGLRHRSVHIFIFNTKGDLYLQKRSPSKDQYPEHWDTSAAGHTDPGESPLEAAQRELMRRVGNNRAADRGAANTRPAWKPVGNSSPSLWPEPMLLFISIWKKPLPDAISPPANCPNFFPTPCKISPQGFRFCMLSTKANLPNNQAIRQINLKY